MKKLITVVLILALLLPAAAMAELTRPSYNIPDISNLSEIELKALLHEIQDRLFSEQLVNGVTVPQSIYIVGEDIPAGDYRVVLTCTISISGGYLSEGETEYSEVAGAFVESGKTVEIGKLTLQEGLKLFINQATAVFYPYTGLFN